MKYNCDEMGSLEYYLSNFLAENLLKRDIIVIFAVCLLTKSSCALATGQHYVYKSTIINNETIKIFCVADISDSDC